MRSFMALWKRFRRVYHGAVGRAPIESGAAAFLSVFTSLGLSAATADSDQPCKGGAVDKIRDSGRRADDRQRYSGLEDHFCSEYRDAVP